jgi:hypothetical protein
MNRSSALWQQLRLWGRILGLWLLLVLAFAGHLVFNNSLPWSEALLRSLRDWAPWAVLAPATAWLAFRFPLERGKLHLSIPIHIVGCMTAVLLCQLVAPEPPLPLGPGPDGLRPGPFGGPRRQGEGPPGGARGPDDFGPGDRPPGDPLGLGPGRRPPEGFPPVQMPPGAPNGPRAQAVRLNGRIMRAQFNVPIYWVIVTIVQAMTYHRRSQEKERMALALRARLADAKLDALRMQLHPHFLFNTLNAISTLVHKDPHAADEMIANLSELLRGALETTEQEIPLRQELEFLDRYLEIQQARFGERLRVEKQVDASALEVRVPTLILQPLVENAIRHGIEPIPTPGVVTIRAQRQQDLLLLSVRDNGPGVKPNVKPSGIGLNNTQARLQELYGPRGYLVMKTGSEGGCSVDLQIPVREKSSG